MEHVHIIYTDVWRELEIFTCLDNNVIYVENFCNNKNDCPDHSDESCGRS